MFMKIEFYIFFLKGNDQNFWVYYLKFYLIYLEFKAPLCASLVQ